MITLRPSGERGHANHGWLQSFHSFSFADYRDPAHMGFGNLRVINEDTVAAGRGFGAHRHENMEIISYVLRGELAHRDSLGNVKTIPPGDVQCMSAGTGVEHSEFNHADGEPTHFLQIWITPNVLGVSPAYAQKTFADADKRGRLRLVASGDGRQDSVRMHADAQLYAGLFDGDESAMLPLDLQRKTYVHLVRGSVAVNGQLLQAGDAALLQNESNLAIGGGRNAELLVFDLAS